MLKGHATHEGTARYSSRFARAATNRFYRETVSGTASSLGIGTYLGAADAATDARYLEALRTALRHGINFIDTSLNYRHQRSERCVGTALAAAAEAGEIQRDEIIVCTKGGFLVPGAVPEAKLKSSDVAGGIHSLAPAFLRDQLDRSRLNLKLGTLDVFYLHNPETQLEAFPDVVVYGRVRAAFQALEECVAAGKLCFYGAATWTAFRSDPSSGKTLSLSRLIELARDVAGDDHHFRYIQLPFNLAMPEGFARKDEFRDGVRSRVLDVASDAGITVVASATLLQSRLAKNLPERIGELFPGAQQDSHRAIQFTRSTPGISVALVGMSTSQHVIENVGVAGFPPLGKDQYLRFYE